MENEETSPKQENPSSAGPVTHLSVRTDSNDKAYQSVAQSVAIAIQDATDNLRNINAISSTALGVAMAQFLETGDSKHAQAIEIAQNMAQKATESFLAVGSNAAKVLNGFPSNDRASVKRKKNRKRSA